MDNECTCQGNNVNCFNCGGTGVVMIISNRLQSLMKLPQLENQTSNTNNHQMDDGITLLDYVQSEISKFAQKPRVEVKDKIYLQKYRGKRKQQETRFAKHIIKSKFRKRKA